MANRNETRRRFGDRQPERTAKGTDDGIVFASIAEVARLFRAAKLSPVELTGVILSRMERYDPRLNAYITITAESALAQAKKAEAELSLSGRRKTTVDRGLLHGIPISLKDNIFTAGIRTTAGSKILRDFVPERDAPVVQRLKDAGAVLLGKTNMHEFAYGVTTNNPYYGAAHNPWDVTRIAGGSSGGSAAAVSAGLAYGSVGTDTGGSIRIPASLCGVVGLKPSIHRVDVSGVIPLSPSLDCVGPLARTAEDAAVLFQAMVDGKNDRAAGTVKLGAKGLSKTRLGMPREFFFDVISSEVMKIFEETLNALRRLGMKIETVSIPSLMQTESAGNRIGWAEAAHYHRQSGWFPSQSEEYSEDVRSRLQAGTKVSATEYLEALDQQKKFIAELRENMRADEIDALVVPTTPIAAPLIGEETTAVGNVDYPTRALLLRLNRPANLAGVPAISVPCGLTRSGLPVGLQLIGSSNAEELLLAIAAVYQQHHPFAHPPNLL